MKRVFRRRRLGLYSLRRQASHSANHPRSGNRAPDVHVKRTIDRVTRDSFGADDGSAQ